MVRWYQAAAGPGGAYACTHSTAATSRATGRRRPLPLRLQRFDGYGTDDEEPVRELAALRFSSLAAEPRSCPAIQVGTRLTAFKRSAIEEVWVDAEVVAKRQGRHEGGRCSCRCGRGGGGAAGRCFGASGGWRVGPALPLCCSTASPSLFSTTLPCPALLHLAHRSFKVRWLDTADAGTTTADLRVRSAAAAS